MARRSPVPIRALARVDEPGGDDPFPPEAEALATRFEELRRQGLRTLVDLAVELGELLLAARPLLHRSFGTWTRERLGLEHSTAGNYVAMALMARQSPQVIERHKELGVSKLYQLARLPAPARQELLRRPDLGSKTDRELKRLVDPYRERTRKVTGNMRAHGLRQKLASYTAALKTARLGRLTDDDLREALREDLRTLRRVVDEALDRLQ